MLIGYGVNLASEEVNLLSNYGADYVVNRVDKANDLESFKRFLEDYKQHELVVPSLDHIGESITLIQLLACLRILRSQDRVLIIVEKKLTQNVSPIEFQDFLIYLGELNRRAIIVRTNSGLEQARIKGKFPGRPKLEAKIIAKIQHLYDEEKMTVRQVADRCKVSIGTVSKYIQQ